MLELHLLFIEFFGWNLKAQPNKFEIKIQNKFWKKLKSEYPNLSICYFHDTLRTYFQKRGNWK